MFNLKEKNIWIIGGAGYLGSALTEALDSLCRKVVCVDLAEKAESLVREKALRNTRPYTFDVSEIGQLEPFLDQMMADEGVPDGVVNLTFISSGATRMEDLTAAAFQKPFDDSVTSYFVIGRHLAEKMKDHGGGSVVNFSSMYGHISPDPGTYPAPMIPNPIDYGASKAALSHLTRYMAVHYGKKGVRFNAVAPGPFPHPGMQVDPEFMAALSAKTPMGRIGRQAETVGPTVFLLSEASSYMTGQILAVDGGWTVW
jgi:NAD(P)-dependent dehydrogenase (short-subunit alcohol dehydrogenase family)